MGLGGAYMSQTRWGSVAESAANIAVGFSINFVANWLIFPLFGANITLKNNFYIGCIYTVISIVRSYILRRYFNGLKFGNAPKVWPTKNPWRLKCGCLDICTNQRDHKL